MNEKTPDECQRSLSAVLITAVMIVVFLTMIPAKGYGQNKKEDQASKSQSNVAATVKMTDQLAFAPDTVTVKTGQAVKWINASVIAHSATDDSSLSQVKNSWKLPQGAEPFNSTVLDPQGTYTHTFHTPGTYKYFCIPHEAIMRGWVIVKEE